MSKRKLWILVFFILLGISALFLSVTAQSTATGTHAGARPSPPAYGVLGPHQVGFRDMVTVTAGETPLAITMWYPAITVGSAEEDTVYPYEIKVSAPIGTVAIASFAGRANELAAPDLSAGPYPLLILSPGFSISATSYAWLAEHLASYGFVVMAPEHNEQFDPGLNEFWQATITRPQDLQRLLAYVDGQTRAGGAVEGLVDTNLIAVIGHSYGGYTALAAAGARINIAGFESRCRQAQETNDPNKWLCDMLLPNVAGMARLAGLDPVPEGLWPSWGDPRVDAIVPLAGDAYLFDQAGLAEINVPVLAIGGTLDSDTPYMWGTHPTYEHSSGQRKARVALDEAEHMIFTGTCEKIPWYAKIVVKEFCSDTAWNRNRAHDLINHFTTAFLLAELKQDGDAAGVLAAEVVNFPGITYAAQGY